MHLFLSLYSGFIPKIYYKNMAIKINSHDRKLTFKTEVNKNFSIHRQYLIFLCMEADTWGFARAFILSQPLTSAFIV